MSQTLLLISRDHTDSMFSGHVMSRPHPLSQTSELCNHRLPLLRDLDMERYSVLSRFDGKRRDPALFPLITYDACWSSLSSLSPYNSSNVTIVLV